MLSLYNIPMKTTKGSQSIAEYMQTIKIIIDDFALINYPLGDDEIILHVLNGLGMILKKLMLPFEPRLTTETPPITTRFHHKFSNHKGNSEKFGGHPETISTIKD
ncbi:hypothetical protein AAG906_026491 [Vitis piasezkii]